MSAGFHPYPHHLAMQRPVELLCFSPVFQATLAVLPSIRIHVRDLLKPRVIITAYNPHVGSFLPGIGRPATTNVLGSGSRPRHEITEESAVSRAAPEEGFGFWLLPRLLEAPMCTIDAILSLSPAAPEARL
jgi:hypothetical protein